VATRVLLPLTVGRRNDITSSDGATGTGTPAADANHSYACRAFRVDKRLI
jgi:hypothetical protein